MEHSTGLPGLDRILHGIKSGDNIVWQVDSIEDYICLVKPYIQFALAANRKLVYFRFAKHNELVPRDSGAKIYELDPGAGFESFITKIHQVIKNTGTGGYYVFDSHSELALDQCSDRMLGNFFVLTCPYLYRLQTVAYFAVLRNYHSYHAALPIAETTQLLLDVYRHNDKLYVHPLKVEGRYSPTMYTLHEWSGDDFNPITESAILSTILTSAPWHGLQSASYRMVGLWDRRFMQAEETENARRENNISSEIVDQAFHRLLPQIVTRDKRMLVLAEKYLNLSDIIYIWKRMIGTGMIGGKSVGMLLARAILKQENERWNKILEDHDSFFIGSDVFYTFLVQNGCWWIRQEQKDPDTFLEKAEEGRKLILNGEFPDYIVKRFSDMLNYYGQSPIIVRSSSLLEDNFGNAFAGKYESVFCPNQGTHQHRLDKFMNAVKIIYASTMSKEALSYRAKRGVLDRDEQMALLIQRVSGAPYKRFFYPQLAGVGLSFNPYAWSKSIDPEAGMLRLVFGLGTRAVERADDDYTHVVALNAPDKHPVSSREESRKHTQKRVDVLDLEENRLVSSYFVDVVNNSPGLPVEFFADLDRSAIRDLKEQKRSPLKPWMLTFDNVISKTSFIKDMREMLKIIKNYYGSHVDIEFTVNFLTDGTYKINLLQCRSLQIKKISAIPDEIPRIKKEDLVLEAHGGIIGQSRIITIDRLIYVIPAKYGKLTVQNRYLLARLIGKLTHYNVQDEAKTIMIIGPGRWGTSMPALGVPITFAEINTVSVICEIDSMHEGLVPDLSLGTHFFSDLVEMDMIYMAFFKAKNANVFNDKLLLNSKNGISAMLPDASSFDEVVRVIEGDKIKKGKKLYLHLDSMKQIGVLYLNS
jgi:pyruvate,water dikinase